MPILVKDYTFEDTPEALFLTVPLRSMPASKVDVYCSDLYVKINFNPFIFELDLFAPISVAESSTKLGNGLAVMELVKIDRQPWPQAKSLLEGEQLKQQRKESQDRELDRIQKLKEARLLEKREREREAVKQQMQVEREKRERVEGIKQKEHDDAASSIKEWAKQTLELEKRQDSAVLVKEQDIFEPIVQPLKIVNTDDLDEVDFEDDEDLDLDFIRNKVRQTLSIREQPPPRESTAYEITFTSRNNIPTQTARETEDAKWRTRIKLAEQMHKIKANAEKQEQMDKLMDKASHFFQLANYEACTNVYTEILEMDPHNLKALSNRAACWLKMENLVACVQDCTNGLSMIDQEQDILKNEFKQDDGFSQERDKSRLKLLVRRGAAFKLIGKQQEAIQDYELALQMDPTNETLLRDLETMRS
ncbi:hypothetical protein EDD86DRAFT_199728, partial [Gorgonomyces haynaldii]